MLLMSGPMLPMRLPTPVTVFIKALGLVSRLMTPSPACCIRPTGATAHSARMSGSVEGKLISSVMPGTTMRVPELLMSTAGLPMASTVFMVTGSAAPRRLADVLAVASNGLPRIEAPMRSPMLDTALPTSRQGWMYWSL